MNTCSSAGIRTLSDVEIALISGGGGPTPTVSNVGTYGGNQIYQFTCPSGYGIGGNQGGTYVNPVQGNNYGGFDCNAGWGVQATQAYQAAGGWTDFQNIFA